MNIEEDAIKRVEWIKARTDLTRQQEDYILFQIKDAVNKANREFNEDKLTIGFVETTTYNKSESDIIIGLNISTTLGNVLDTGHWEDFCDKYGYDYYSIKEGADKDTIVSITADDAKKWGLI